MENLKKCPFCGGEAKIIIKDWDNKADEYKVVCTKCGASIEDYYFNKESAIRLWNNRATEAELRANVIDEFAEAIIVKATEASEKAIFDGKLLGDALSLDCVSDMVLEIALHMKGEKE